MLLFERLKNYGHLLLAMAAYWYYGRPARQMIVVGVTGTKGKTTSSRLIASVLEASGQKVGLLSTAEFQIGGERVLNTKKMTMLGHGAVQKMLRQMVAAGCTYAVVETSSQGILQYRHYGLHYDIAVFTNLSPEHIEAHGGFANLRKDKGKMFAALRKSYRKTIHGHPIPKVIIVNGDDENAAYYLNFKADKKIAYSVLTQKRNPVDTEVHAHDIHSTATGNTWRVGDTEYALHLWGEFNVSNALAAIAVGQAAGLAPCAIAKGLASVTGINGRLELIEAGQPFKIIIDYAHEPRSLEAALQSVRTLLLKPNQKLIAVIGSDGGGRDQSKRATTGALAAKLADTVIVTTTDPYDEDPGAIVTMVAKGALETGYQEGQNLFSIPDRRTAIEKALSLAGEGDAVILTAKGHETCMAIGGGQKIPWNDRDVATELLSKYTRASSVV